MRSTKEIKALFHLLDDPDLEIYNTVSDKIIHYGKEIIPNLEDYWEHTENNEVQERIEDIIHKVNLNHVNEQFERWTAAEQVNLLEGSIILSKLRYPDVDEKHMRKVMGDIKQACWLELNNYLTPLEQVNIINSIFYSMFKFQGMEIEETKPNHFFISDVFETKTGNNYSLALIYQQLCEMLDIPVFAVMLPKQYFLAYFGNNYDYRDTERKSKPKIQFYIDPCSGVIYSQNDVDVYIKKYELSIEPENFLPQNAKQVMFQNLEALAFIYEQQQDEEKYREVKHLLSMFEN
jgi:regulator of sirC expression with transglutaminase-like and TPR domain